MVDTSKCDSCKYRAKLNEVTVCRYILVTRKRRECYEGVCDKYEKGKPYAEPFNERYDR